MKTLLFLDKVVENFRVLVFTGFQEWYLESLFKFLGVLDHDLCELRVIASFQD